MKYYLGIDIGTTSTKVVAFTEVGEVLVATSTEYEIHHPKPNYSEQNPDEIYTAISKGLQNLLTRFAPDLPVFISFSSAMHSLIAVDDKGGLLTQCIIWADNRSAAIAEQLKQLEKGKQFYHSTGVPIHSMSPLCKLLWLKENEPEVFESAYKFISIKEYVLYKMFGEYLVDSAIASASGLLNLKTLEWDEGVLEYIGIAKEKLSKVVSTKHTLHINSKEPDDDKLQDIPFIIGSSDGALSNIGAGAVDTNVLAVNIGTSSAARLLQTTAVTDDAMRFFCYHANDDKYIVGGASNNGAVVLQWLKDDVLQTEEGTDDLIQTAENIQAGSDGLIMLTYIMGERAPIWNPFANGVFFGVTSRHTKPHFIRAAMEAVIFSVYSIGKPLLQENKIAEIKASGGFTKSELWVQILADVFNIKVSVANAVESTAWGAVMIGMEALGLPYENYTGRPKVYEPDTTNNKIYEECFLQFERLYELLKNEMKPNEG